MLALCEEQGEARATGAEWQKGRMVKARQRGWLHPVGLVGFGFAERGWKRSPFYQRTPYTRSQELICQGPGLWVGPCRPCVLLDGS